MFTISKEFHFSASHQLTHLLEEHPDHQCGRLHGHNYVVRVFLKGEELNFDGFVLDYGELKFFGDYINNKLDHRHLNDVLGSSIATTAESLAKHLYGRVRDWINDHELGLSDYIWCDAVEVQETPKTCARYESRK